MNNDKRLGVNLEANRDYNHGDYFINRMLSARAFGSAAAPWDGKAIVDSLGWPKTDFGAVVFTKRPGADGTYLFTAMGGEISKISLVASGGKVEGLKFDPITGITTATITVAKIKDTNQASLNLAFTGVKGLVLDLHLIKQGDDPKARFTHQFLNAMSIVGAVRFMDILETNGSKQAKWADRPTLEHSTYNYPGKGWPLEVAVELCNVLGIDPYINEPALADEDYSGNAASLVSGQLKKGLTCYIEKSNELWNWKFPQSHWNDDLAKASGSNYIARTVDVGAAMGKLWRKSWKGDAGLKVVLGTQVGNDWLMSETQKAAKKNYDGIKKAGFDCFAVAPYFSNIPNEEGWTPEQVAAKIFRDSGGGVGGGGVSVKMQQAAKIAADEGVEFIAYECGIDVGNPKKSIASVDQAQYLPIMKAAVARYLCRLFGPSKLQRAFYYTLTSSFGDYVWGLSDDISNLLDDPKYQGAEWVSQRAIIGGPDPVFDPTLIPVGWVDAPAPSPVPTPTPTPTPSPDLQPVKLMIQSMDAQLGAAKVLVSGNVSAVAAVEAVQKQSAAAKVMIEKL